MRISTGSRARRAIALIIICVAPLFAPATLVAGPLDLHKLATPTVARTEPFGLFTVPLSEGGLRDKWAGVQAKLRDEQRVLDACRDDRVHCADPAASEFLRIVDAARARDGLARLGEINRAINLAIRPMSDLANYGEIDVWSSPLATLARGAGDCEDYAIAKMAALKEAGIAPQDLRLVILRDSTRAEDHAVLAVRLQNRWIVLDNRMLVMLQDTQLGNYKPIFVVDEQGVRAYRNPAPVEEQQPYQQDIAYLVSAQAGAPS